MTLTTSSNGYRETASLPPQHTAKPAPFDRPPQRPEINQCPTNELPISLRTLTVENETIVVEPRRFFDTEGWAACGVSESTLLNLFLLMRATPLHMLAMYARRRQRLISGPGPVSRCFCDERPVSFGARELTRIENRRSQVFTLTHHWRYRPVRNSTDVGARGKCCEFRDDHKAAPSRESTRADLRSCTRSR